MNESPITTLQQKKDRRGLLALMGAGGAAALAALLSRNNGAQAADNPTYHESSTSTAAVRGENFSTGAGVYGWSNSGPGVVGGGNSAYGVYGWGKTGVCGVGKWAVLGKANTAGGTGVFGNAGSGSTGVYAAASGTKKALRVAGRASFKQSGKAWVPKNKQSVDEAIDYELNPDSLVLATIQSWSGAGIAVRRAYIKKDDAGKWRIVRISLTKSYSSPVKVAYFIFSP